MGCGTSQERSIEVTPEPPKKPTINVSMGPSVTKPDTEPRIIVVLGGPGSKKGTIIEDLITVYGYTLLSVEDILLQSLPKKLKLTFEINNTADFKEVIRENPTHVDLHWILDVIMRKIEEKKRRGSYVIDMMPNLKWLLKSDKFIKDPTQDMGEFEEKYKISFALYLDVPEAQLLDNMTQYCTKTDAESTGMKKEGQSDEADTSKTKKRAKLFLSTTKPYLDYFNKSGRLVTVDVSSGETDYIWDEIHRLFNGLEMPALRTVNSFMLFAFDNTDLEGIDNEYYQLTMVNAEDSLPDPNAGLGRIVEQICQHIDKSSGATEAFMFNMSGTSLKNQEVGKADQRSIMFMDVEEDVLLDKYLPHHIVVRPICTKRFKAVITMENEVCLFPEATPTELCRQVGLQIQQYREAY